MSKVQILGIIRHVLTFVGGVLLTKGLIDEQMWSEITGSLITLVGGVVEAYCQKIYLFYQKLLYPSYL